MKQILIVSDTHGLLRNLYRLLERFPSPDLLIHLGDAERDAGRIPDLVSCRTIMVAGNCDRSAGLPSEEVLELGGERLFLTHGHRYAVHYGYELLAETAKNRGCGIAMFGHTHTSLIREVGGVTLVNPGSLSLPRPSGSRPSYAIMDFDREGGAHFSIGYFD